MIDIHPLKLVEINRSTYVSFNQEYRVQFITFKGGKGEWIISKNSDAGWMNAIDHAPTFQAARARYHQIAKEVAA
jgi:hypothetical protein